MRSHAHSFVSRIEGCETMRIVSSYQCSRIEDYELARMVTACLCSEFEDCEAKRMVSKNVENLENCTFRNSGTPVRRTTRRKYQEVYFQKFWDSCAQSKTSHISKHALCLVGSMSPELCLNSAWSQDMKYRATLPPILWYSLPCGFSVSGTLPKS